MTIWKVKHKCHPSSTMSAIWKDKSCSNLELDMMLEIWFQTFERKWGCMSHLMLFGESNHYLNIQDII